jgi:hypothetical protein
MQAVAAMPRLENMFPESEKLSIRNKSFFSSKTLKCCHSLYESRCGSKIVGSWSESWNFIALLIGKSMIDDDKDVFDIIKA